MKLLDTPAGYAGGAMVGPVLALLALGAMDPDARPLSKPCQLERPAYGPQWVLPLEAAQGATLGRGAPAPYAASLRLHPTYILDRKHQLRVAATAGPALVNPDLELLLGGRITRSVFELNLGPLRGIGLHLGAEALYGTSGRGLVGVVAIADGGGLLQVTVRVEPDVTNGATLLEFGLGANLREGKTLVDTAGPVITETITYADSVRDRMIFDTRGVVGDLRDRDPSGAACETFLQSAHAFLRRTGPRPATVGDFRQALREHGLAVLEKAMTEPPPLPPGAAERVRIDALYRGLAEGISPPER